MGFFVSLSVQGQEPWSLDRCIAYAREHATEVRRQTLEQEQKHADYRTALLDFLPSVSAEVNGQYSWGRNIDPETNTYNNVTTFNNYYALGASVTLFDGGATWTNAASATGETTQTVSGNGTHVLYWVVNTKHDTPTRYRVILTTGSKTSAVYLDDFTLYYRSATGDINGDGVVNVTDVTALINVILGSASYDASLCDINGDGTINVTDVTALLNLILAAE